MINIMKPKAGKEKKFGKKMSKMLWILIIAIAVVFIGAGICYAVARSGYVKTWQLASQLQKQQQASADDQKILVQLKKIILLPEDATPTMAVITDVGVLQKQQPVFFNNAKNGNHLIIYPDMAIIYDYEANKIMKVGPVQIATPVDTSTPAKASN